MQKKTIDILNLIMLVIAILGFMALLGRGLADYLHFDNYPLDSNYIASALMISYTAITGLKFIGTGRQKQGIYLLLFMAIVILILILLSKYSH